MKRRAAVLIVALTWVCTFSARGLAEMTQRGQAESRSLIGHVLDRQDQPVSKAIVYLKNTKTLAIKTYITEPNGSYRFPALAPNVDYEVYAEFQGARSDAKTLSGFDSRKTANITLRIK
jgi:carboxypeptidase family protein